MQPGARRIPVADDGAHRDTERFSRLLDGEPTKESQLDDLARSWIDRRQFSEGVVQGDDVYARCRCRDLSASSDSPSTP